MRVRIFLPFEASSGADRSFRKQFQKILQKQGLKFKLNTKVLGAELDGETVKLKVDAAKGGKEETVSFVVDLFVTCIESRFLARRRCCPCCDRTETQYR